MPSRPVTFGAVGDIDLSRTDHAAIERLGHAWPFELMRPHLAEADLLFGNMESVILPPDYPPDQIDPKGLVSFHNHAPCLQHAGFDIVNLAQNHILDGGTRGMFHTQSVIEAAGVATAGIGATQAEARQLRVIEKNGLSFGFLCYAEDSNYTLSTTGPCYAYYTRENVLADIERHRRDVDVLVVSIHADLEFIPTPSPPRRAIMREAARAGATIVLAHHPHVPQGIERVGDALLVYSLGNFIFPAYSSSYMRINLPHTAHSFLLLADVTKGRVGNVRRIPFDIAREPDERPTPMDASAQQQMLSYFDELDRLAVNDEAVRANWRAAAIEQLRRRLAEAPTLTVDDLLHDLLGRLLLVQENRNWIDEIFTIVQENWRKQANTPNPLHRPHHAKRGHPTL